MVSPLDPFLARTHIAYFSMEIAIRSEMHTYAGGLEILAGDTARSRADLELPLVFVTLVSLAGYFRQRIDGEGRQVEEPDPWQPAAWCTPLEAMIAVAIEGLPVWIRPWLYIHTCPHGHRIPILLLDTDLDQNAAAERALTHSLYGGDEAYRLKQEIVLGIGGARLLRNTDPRNPGASKCVSVPCRSKIAGARLNDTYEQCIWSCSLHAFGAPACPGHNWRQLPKTTQFCRPVN